MTNASAAIKGVLSHENHEICTNKGNRCFVVLFNNLFAVLRFRFRCRLFFSSRKALRSKSQRHQALFRLNAEPQLPALVAEEAQVLVDTVEELLEQGIGRRPLLGS